MRELRTASLREAPYARRDARRRASRRRREFRRHGGARARPVRPPPYMFLPSTEGHPAGLVGAFIDDAGRGRAVVRACALRSRRPCAICAAASCSSTASYWLAQQGAAEIYAWIADENRGIAMRFTSASDSPTGDRRSMPAHAEEWGNRCSCITCRSRSVARRARREAFAKSSAYFRTGPPSCAFPGAARWPLSLKNMAMRLRL